MTAINPTTVWLSDHILLSDLVGCDSVYRHGYANPVFDTDHAKLREGYKLAETLDTTVDYLLTGNPVEETPLASANLFRRFKALEAFSEEDKTTVIHVIDAIIAKRRVEGALQPVDQQQANG